MEVAVSALDEIAAAIDAVGEKIEEALNATQAIDQEIDEASSTAGALGANATVEGLAQLSSEIQTLAQQLGAAGETKKEALVTARSVAENT